MMDKYENTTSSTTTTLTTRFPGVNDKEVIPSLPKFVKEDSLKARPAKLFLLYSHNDEKYKKELETYFVALRRSDKIETWKDSAIEAGHNWLDSIKKGIKNSDIVLLLLSPDFLATDFIWKTEIRIAKKNGIKIIPINLRPFDVINLQSEIFNFRSLPLNGTWIVSSQNNDRNAAYKEVVDDLIKIIG